MLPRLCRVRRIRREIASTYTLELEPGEGEGGEPFQPGQFNMLYAFGVGEAPISFSGDPADQAKLVHTVRAVGAVSRALTRLKPGDMLGVRGPFGTSWPVARAEGKDVIILSGGLGMAPLRPALYQLLTSRERYGRVSLLYGTRSAETVLYPRQLARWRRAGLECLVTVDRAVPGWDGEVGMVTRLISRVLTEPENTVALICGPEIMMRSCAVELEKLAVPTESVYLSLERNMKCAVGFCGHCQFGPKFICQDGPVFAFSEIERLLFTREV
jgi:NAD(P)H-flavin reductase